MLYGVVIHTQSKVAVVFAIRQAGTDSHSGCGTLRNTPARPGSSSAWCTILKLDKHGREKNTWSVTDSVKFPSFSIAIAIYISARLRARTQACVYVAKRFIKIFVLDEAVVTIFVDKTNF